MIFKVILDEGGAVSGFNRPQLVNRELNPDPSPTEISWADASRWLDAAELELEGKVRELSCLSVMREIVALEGGVPEAAAD